MQLATFNFQNYYTIVQYIYISYLPNINKHALFLVQKLHHMSCVYIFTKANVIINKLRELFSNCVAHHGRYDLNLIMK